MNRATHQTILAIVAVLLLDGPMGRCSAYAANLKVGTFSVDVTPPPGSALCFGLTPPATGSADPLSARGVVLVPKGQAAIVLAAVDWVGVSNAGHDAWREALAQACSTTVDRVAVHTLHQHDAPGCDFSAAKIAADAGLESRLMNVEFARSAIQHSAAAAANAAATARRATHVGHGAGVVYGVASNRRILGPDGNVQFQRMSSCANAELRALPEGTIDPLARVVSFWDGDQPLAVLSFYATHPQSYYRTGKTSADFVGVARDAREAEVPGALHVHFNGAAGNVAAGKYNDGSPPMRAELGRRLAAGLNAAWRATKRESLDTLELEWKTISRALPRAEWLDRDELQSTLRDEKAPTIERLQSARALAFLERTRAGHQITFGRLRLGEVDMLYFPGEMFVEYQLAAQRLAPQRLVCFAAYGDLGPGYIGLGESYAQGGYETGRVSRVSPRVEPVLMQTIQELLKER